MSPFGDNLTAMTERPRVHLPNWRVGVGFALVSLVVSLTCWRLGLWQYHRYIDHRSANTTMQQHLDQPAVEPHLLVPLGMTATQTRLDPSLQWRAVRLQGTWVPGSVVLWRNRTHQGRPGVDVLSALRTSSGQVWLVDRGWQPRDQVLPHLPQDPVQVQGWLRNDEGAQGEHELGWATAGDTGAGAASLARLEVAAVATKLNLPLAPGLVQAEGGQGPQPLSTTRHITYAWQWWLFALMAPVGFVLLARRHAEDHHCS